jgi:hypothetical protein
MISTLIMVMGMSIWGQMALEMHVFTDIMHNMGNQQEEVYNFWCGGIRCDEYGHGGYDGVPEDCTTESEEDGTCGFGLVQP